MPAAKRDSPAAKRNYHHGDLRRALLDAAWRLVAEKGLADLTLRELARAAGVSHAAPYHHFPSRTALLDALAEEGFAGLDRAMGEAKAEISSFAPKLFTMKINPEKIRDVIGKGGATIRALTEETGTQININEDGTITIAATDGAKADEAKRRIEQITAEVEIGKVYEGPVTKLLDFGALINLLPGKDGLLHISQIAHERVEKVSDYLQEGQIVKVKVLETDEKGRVKLSMKALIDRPAAPSQSE